MVENVKIIRKKIKNMYLVVNPDCSVVVKAPVRVSDEYINSFIKKKESWIKKHLENFESLNSKSVAKKYIDGELFKYLGNEYILKVYHSKKEYLEISDNFFNLYVLETDDFEKKKKIVEKFYRKRAEIELFEIFKSNYKVVTEKMPDFAVRKMKKRWGSCSFHKNKIILNERLIEKSKDCIEYVVFHELAHLRYPNHSKDFYNYLTELMPEWKIKKLKLNERH
ncbi:SprT family zinc-dependent metalloprotease [Methanococcus maripaludis]|uniref:M48 family metallopeptidase n=1 Tax=Methanococcus maripaludis TaxID=39152 RepID=UPI003142C034